MPFSVETFLGIVMTEPLVPCSVELATVNPQIGVRTRVGAEFTELARSFATATRRTFLVRTAQTFHVVASDQFNSK